MSRFRWSKNRPYTGVAIIGDPLFHFCPDCDGWVDDKSLEHVEIESLSTDELLNDCEKATPDAE